MVFRAGILMRGTVELSIAVLYIVALGHLPLADLTAIMQSTPLIIALYLAVTGVERMGWRRWAAVLVGFGGVLLVVRPGGASFGIFSVLAFVSAILVAVRDLTTRRIGSEIPTVLILTASVSIIAAGGAGLSLLEGWKPMSIGTVAILAGAAFFVVLGNYCGDHGVPERRDRGRVAVPLQCHSLGCARRVLHLRRDAGPGGRDRRDAHRRGGPLHCSPRAHQVPCKSRGCQRLSATEMS